MRKSKKGFTLIELIAVIVLLAIIMTIAITSISSIKSRVNERRYNQLVTTIETAAEKYAADTGAQVALVQTLINRGLIEADNETGDVVDPRDSSSLNCQQIIIEGDEAKLDYHKGAICDEELLAASTLAIKYRFEGKSEVNFFNNKWLNKSIILVVDDLSRNLKLEDVSKDAYSWITPLAPDDVIHEKELAINEANISDTYQVTIEKDGIEYRTSQIVKIDKVAPLVSDFYVSDPDSWTSTKNLNFKITDSGSGIAGYAFSSYNDEGHKPGSDAWITKNNGHTIIGEHNVNISGKEVDFTKIDGFADTKKLYIWTKDIAGNISANEDVLGTGTSEGFDVNIDLDGADNCIGSPEDNAQNPTCQMSISKSTNEWTKEITLTGTAIDSKSGLVAYQFTSSDEEPSKWQTIPKTNEPFKIESESYAKSSNYYFWVKDAVDNVSGIHIVVDNVDSKSPTVGVTGAPVDWIDGDVELTINAKDTRINYKGENVDGANYEGKIYEDQEEQATKASGVNRYICTTINDPEKISNYPNKYQEGKNTCKVTSYQEKYYVWAIDHAGNVSTSNSNGFNIKIDKGAPEVSISANRGTTSWTNQNVTLTGTARDNLSGVAATKFDTESYVAMAPERNKPVTKTKTLSNEGSYTHTFCAKDKLGHERCTSGLRVNIDKTAPKINNITKTPSSGWTKSVTISFTPTDTLSGISSSKCNGQNGTSCVVTKNGTYTISATDNAGNTTSQNVRVDNIDTTKPTVSISANRDTSSWINQDVTLIGTASDSQSKIAATKFDNLPYSQITPTDIVNPTLIFKNEGTSNHIFCAKDKVGNEKCSSSITIKIDKKKPVISNINISPSSGWGKSATISFTATDPAAPGANGSSGIKSITCNNLSGSSCTVTNNGTYTITATDFAGNTERKQVEVTNIDKTPPTLNVSQSPLSSYKCDNSVTISLSGSDSGSGIKPYSYRCNGNASSTCTIDKTGTYYFSVSDYAGNTTTETITVRFDSTPPKFLEGGGIYRKTAGVPETIIYAGTWEDDCDITTYYYAYTVTKSIFPNSNYSDLIWHESQMTRYQKERDSKYMYKKYIHAYVKACDSNNNCSDAIHVGSHYCNSFEDMAGKDVYWR